MDSDYKIPRVEGLCSHTTAFPWTIWSTHVDNLSSRIKGYAVQVHSGVRNTKRQKDLYNEVWELFTENFTGVPALLPCSMMPRQARGPHKKNQISKPSVQLILFLSMSLIPWGKGCPLQFKH